MKQLILKNKEGMQVGLTDFGATVTEMLVPDKDGRFANVVLSYAHLRDYIQDPYYIGATVGRYANRLNSGELMLDGKRYQLSINDVENNNHLHGGFSGFGKKTWQVTSKTTSSVEMTYVSLDGEEGYPGDLQVTVSFVLKDGNELWIHYQATTTKTTIVNLCNHSYFNLSDSLDIRTQHLQIHAGYHTPSNAKHIPDGTITSVENTIYDLNRATLLSEIMQEFDTINYVFRHTDALQLMAKLTDRHSGRCLQISSTQPGMQLYFGNYLSRPFGPFQGLCMEPQHFPDAPNKRAFPSPILRPSEIYSHAVCYKFTTV